MKTSQLPSTLSSCLISVLIGASIPSSFSFAFPTMAVAAQPTQLPAKTAAAAAKIVTPAGKTAPVAGSSNRDWEAAKALFLANNYKGAAQAYYLIGKNSRDLKMRRQSKYYLGLSLYRLGFKQVAAFPFVDLVRTGEMIEKQKALDHVVMIADELGEPSLLNYSLNHIRPDELSDVSKAIFLGRLGEASLSKGDTAQASAYFSKALEYKKNENSLLYSLGLTELIGKNPDKAVTFFSQLADRLQNQPINDLQRGLAVLGQARSYYQTKRYKDAADLYRQIPKDHPLYRESLMELSWALFRSGQFRSALSPLQTLHTPFYENFYDPESLILQATIYLFVCQYDRIDPIMTSFQKNYYPAFGKIEEWLNSPRGEADYYIEVAKTRKALVESRLKGKISTETNLPFFVMRTLIDEPEIRNLIEYLDKIYKERQNLSKAFGRSGLVAYGNQILEGRKRAVQKQVGVIVKDRLMVRLHEFAEFATQFDFLKYEVLNGKRLDLKKKISENAPEQKIDEGVSRDFYIQNGYRFWPFEGEYWRDEIGNYQYVGVNRCEKSAE